MKFSFFVFLHYLFDLALAYRSSFLSHCLAFLIQRRLRHLRRQSLRHRSLRRRNRRLSHRLSQLNHQQQEQLNRQLELRQLLRLLEQQQLVLLRLQQELRHLLEQLLERLLHLQLVLLHLQQERLFVCGRSCCCISRCYWSYV